MKVLGIIPARYTSSRFPGKPLIDLKGKSMIQRVYEGCLKSTLLTDLIVATDDERIYSHVEEFGGKAMLTSEKHRSGTERCGEVAQKVSADIVINIQGDEPLVDARQLDILLQAFQDEQVQIASVASRKVTKEDLKNPNRIKVVVDANNNALYFSRSAIPNSANFQGDALSSYPFLRHIGLYAYRSICLQELVRLPVTAIEKTESLEQLRWMYHGYSIRMVETDIETPNIDTSDDMEKVLKLL